VKRKHSSTDPVTAYALGGQFQFAAVAGAETDFALFAFQVPAAAAAGGNRNLVIRADALVSATEKEEALKRKSERGGDRGKTSVPRLISMGHWRDTEGQKTGIIQHKGE